MSLPEELKRHLRSGIAISSMTQCVEELVRLFCDMKYLQFHNLLKIIYWIPVGFQRH